MALVVKNLSVMEERKEMQAPSLDQEDLLEEVTAIQSSILAWRIPGTGEPGGVPQSRTESDTTERLN